MNGPGQRRGPSSQGLVGAMSISQLRVMQVLPWEAVRLGDLYRCGHSPVEDTGHPWKGQATDNCDMDLETSGNAVL